MVRCAFPVVRMFVVSLLLACVVGGTDKQEQVRAQDTAASPLSLVVIGDSIPRADFCTACERGFVDELADRMEAELGVRVSVTNKSRNDGATLNKIANQVEVSTKIQQELAGADVVLVSDGFNDGPPWTPSLPCGTGGSDFTPRALLDAILTYTPECLDEAVAIRIDDYQRLFDSMSAHVSADALVIVLNVYDAWTGWPEFSDVGTDAELAQMSASINYFLTQWNSAECELADQHGFVCADLHGAFNGANGSEPAGDLLEADYTHPSAKGNGVIADVVLDVVMNSDHFASAATPAATPVDDFGHGANKVHR